MSRLARLAASLSISSIIAYGAKPPYTCWPTDRNGNIVHFARNGRLIGETPQKVKTAAENALTLHAAEINSAGPWTYVAGETYIDREKPTLDFPFKWEIRYRDASGIMFEVDLYEATVPKLQAIEKSITKAEVSGPVLQAAQDKYPQLDVDGCFLQLSHEFSRIDSTTGAWEEHPLMRNLEFDECPNEHTYNGQMDLEVVDLDAGEPFAVNTDIYDVTNPKLPADPYPLLRDEEGNNVTLLDNGRLLTPLPSRVPSFAEIELNSKAATIGMTGPFTFTGIAFVDTEKPTALHPFKWELKYRDSTGTEVEVDIYEGTQLILQALEKTIAKSDIEAAVMQEVEAAVAVRGAGNVVNTDLCIYQMSYEFKYVDGTTGLMQSYPDGKRNLELDECQHSKAFSGLQDLEVLDLQTPSERKVVFDLYDTTNPKFFGRPCKSQFLGRASVRPCDVRDYSGSAVTFKSNGKLIGEPPERVKLQALSALGTHAAAIGLKQPLTYTGNTYVDREKPTLAYPFKWEIRYSDGDGTVYEVDMYEAEVPVLQAIEKSINEIDVAPKVLRAAQLKYPGLQASQCFLQLSHEFSQISGVTGMFESISRRNLEFDECPNPQTYNGQMDLEVVDIEGPEPYTVNTDIYDVTNPKLPADDFPTLTDVDNATVTILTNGKLVGDVPARVRQFALNALNTEYAKIGARTPFTYTGNTFVDSEKPTRLHPFKWEVKFTDADSTGYEVDVYEGDPPVLQAIEKSINYNDIDAAVLQEVQEAIDSAGAAGIVHKDRCIYQESYEYVYIDSILGLRRDYPAGKRNLELDECEHSNAHLGLQDLEVLDIHGLAPHNVTFDLYDVTNPKLAGAQCSGGAAQNPNNDDSQYSDGASRLAHVGLAALALRAFLALL